MTRSAAWLALTLLWPLAAGAQAPEATPRPEARPAPAVEVTRRAPLPVVAGAEGVVLRSLRPSPRPDVVPAMSAWVRRDSPDRVAGAGEAICGDPSIQGRDVAPIEGRIRGCGVADPVAVTAVAGVALSDAAVMDCTTARALKEWVQEGVKPVVGRRGGGVVGLRVAAHYACRTRNNQSGAKISEHGKGRAIDISAIRLANGNVVTVEQGWGRLTTRRMLRRMHRNACGTFGTVLGPRADRFHQDHFHLDTARYRGGAYCR
ncbi:Uncharacterized conserved protein [Tranquillimonas rosea]|uniref:Uncharacterized conserved protein n=1 Tax=Tranquillimonas rosea TaxID=641238 RepID=A0A1H9RHE1_9RHOB|nr:extensin family protein [Tranquillimonas rosea]SER72230.1 Uncharacterized conserved protein [Tranquillimonas rosea]